MARAPRDRGTGAVRKLPSGRWQARMLVNGTHVSLGSYAQKADANAALRDALGRQDTGTWVDPREGKITFATYADEWIASRHDLAMRTRQDYEDLLRLHLKPAFGTTPLADISVLTVLRWWSRASGPRRARPGPQDLPAAARDPQHRRRGRPHRSQPLPDQGRRRRQQP